MYTIKRAAELTGVSEATLRAWERRYGVGASHRSDSGYRLYDDDAIRLLSRLNHLVAEGWSVRAAAEAVRNPDAADAADPLHEHLATERSQPVTDHVPAHEIGALASVAARLDGTRLTRVLDEHFAAASFEATIDDWLLPALREVGQGWAQGSVSVAGEHLVAGAVGRRLAAAYDAAGEPLGAPRVLVGLPPGAHHDIGLLAYATALRRAGLATIWLGADVPVEDWATAVAADRPDAVVLALPMPQDSEGARRVVDAIRRQRPDLLIAVGGGAQDLAPADCLRLGHRIGSATEKLSRRLGSARPVRA